MDLSEFKGKATYEQTETIEKGHSKLYFCKLRDVFFVDSELSKGQYNNTKKSD